MDDDMFYCYKVVLLGDSGAGKTCLLNRFTDGTFNADFSSTIGVDFKLKTWKFNGKLMKIQFWDTAGQERFRAVVTSYHRSVNGVILVYDITNRRSFNSILQWKKVVEDYNPKDDFAVAIIGNKCDIPAEKRQVSTEEGQMLADDHGALFFETSAKLNISVAEAFDSLIHCIRDNANFSESKTAQLNSETAGTYRPVNFGKSEKLTEKSDKNSGIFSCC